MNQSDLSLAKEKIYEILRLKYYFRGDELLRKIEMASASLDFSTEELVQTIKEEAVPTRDTDKDIVDVYLPNNPSSAEEVQEAILAAAVIPYELSMLDGVDKMYKPVRPDCLDEAENTREYAIQVFAANRLGYFRSWAKLPGIFKFSLRRLSDLVHVEAVLGDGV